MKFDAHGLLQMEKRISDIHQKQLTMNIIWYLGGIKNELHLVDTWKEVSIFNLIKPN